jgi:hypothetical protein
MTSGFLGPTRLHLERFNCSSIDCDVNVEPSRSGSGTPTLQKPRDWYKCIAGLTASVTPKQTHCAPRPVAHAMASSSKARPAPVPRDEGATHIWKSATTGGSLSEDLHHTRPQGSVCWHAIKTWALGDVATAWTRAAQVASSLPASCSYVLENASGDSRKACTLIPPTISTPLKTR